MEWVETTAKTVEDAKDRALDQLGVGVDDAEFEIIEEPRSGLFGRLRGEARVRARVKPASVRPKHDRRQRARKRDDRRKGAKDGPGAKGGGKNGSGGRSSATGGRSGGRQQDEGSSDTASQTADGPATERTDERSGTDRSRSGSGGRNRNRGDSPRGGRKDDQQTRKDRSMNDEQRESEVTPTEVGEAARTFMDGLVSAFGAEGSTDVEVDGTEIDVRVSGRELGLLVGPGGQTLTAVQDLARVAAQRRLGDHDTRLRIDVGGYREKRREALEKFAVAVAQQVRETGTTKALEPMSSADRKVVHDAIAAIEGVSSRSDGDDPSRRVVISPD